MREPTIEVIIPVQNLADQLAHCVLPLIDQCGPSDVITVVDDASTDQTGEKARQLGARVFSLATSSGPYRARQLAAGASQADVLLFIDGRCRPQPGLIDSHRSMHTRKGVALSCTNVRTRTGPSLAARVSARRQLFSLQHFIGRPGRMDFFPTANLAIGREAFEKVGGFRMMRSGADADICFRIQRDGLGAMAVDTRILMEWEPRNTLRDLASQSFRYGKSYAYLEWVHSEDPTVFDRALPPDRPATDQVITRGWRRFENLARSPKAEVAVSVAYQLVFHAGHTRARLSRRKFEVPRPYGPIDR